MPAYNEEESISRVVEEWAEAIRRAGEGSRFVILNDGSKDGTLNVLNKLKEKFSFLEVIDKPNSGHGPTCLMGYKHAVEQGADYVFQTDSDGQTSIKDFWPFWEERDNYDLIIGFRAVRGDGAARWFISRFLRCVIWVIFGVFVKDANTPFRLMKTEKLKKNLALVPEKFFLANVLLATLFVKNGEKVRWRQIAFAPRTGGVPSISFKKFFRVGLKVIDDLWRFKHRAKV